MAIKACWWSPVQGLPSKVVVAKLLLGLLMHLPTDPSGFDRSCERGCPGHTGDSCFLTHREPPEGSLSCGLSILIDWQRGGITRLGDKWCEKCPVGPRSILHSTKYTERPLIPRSGARALDNIGDRFGGSPLIIWLQELPQRLFFSTISRLDPALQPVFFDRYATPETNPAIPFLTSTASEELIDFVVRMCRRLHFRGLQSTRTCSSRSGSDPGVALRSFAKMAS